MIAAAVAWLTARLWPIIAATVFVVGLFGWGYTAGKGSAERAHAEERAIAAENALLNSRAGALRQAHNEGVQRAENAVIERELLAAIASLRDRPERLPATAAAACTGTTGRELARPDAEFLTRYAAERKKWIAEVIACQESEDNLRAMMERAAASKK